MGIWESLQDWWWRGHSATHHNREVVDVARMKRTIRDLRKDGQTAMADRLQQIVDQEEAEARDAERKGL